MRVLLVVLSDSGHLNPMIGIAQELEKADTEVAFFSFRGDVASQASRAGLAARCFSSGQAPSPEAATVPGSYPSITFTKRRRQPAWLRLWLSQALIDQLPGQVAALREVVDRFKPDVIGVDAMAYAGAVVGERAGIPWASIATALVPLTPDGFSSTWNDVFKALAANRAKAVEGQGASLAFAISDVVSPWLNTVFALPDFVEPDERRGHGPALVGPAHSAGKRGDEPAFPWERIPSDRPLVYVSFGSMAAPELPVLKQIVHAFEPREAHVVIAAKELATDPIFADLPGNVTVTGYAPQLRLLERASVMITHAGYNSVSECLLAGTPMLAIPLIYDQSLNAHFVERAGAGRVLDVGSVSREAVRASVLPMMQSDAPERERLRQISRAYRASNGSLRVAQLLRQLGETGERIAR